MIDGVIETYPVGKVPEELLKRKERILSELESLRNRCDPIVEVLENEDVKELMESPRDREGKSKVLEYIQQKYGVCFYFCWNLTFYKFLVQSRRP
jgi:hypothetical protein